MSETPDINRRRFVASAATTVAASQLGVLAFSRRVQAMTSVLTDVEKGSETTDVRPFQFKASDADLADLRRRVNAVRWPERETVKDTSQGVQLETMQQLARYWGREYDWSTCQVTLDAVPPFVSET